jgi:hypothetical protein
LQETEEVLFGESQAQEQKKKKIKMYAPPSCLTFQLLIKEERLCAEELSLLVKSFSALPSSKPHSPPDLLHKLSVTPTPT